MAITEADLFMVIDAQSVVIDGVPCVEMITKEREVMPKKAIAVPLVEQLTEKRLMWLRFGLHLIIKI